MEYFGFALFCVAVFASFAHGQEQQWLNTEYQPEHITHSDSSINWVWRSQANGLKSLRFVQGGRQAIYLKLCVEPQQVGGYVQLVLENIRYANDGPSDNITATIDNKQVGTLRTHNIWGNGHFWNKFYDSGRIGNVNILQTGTHGLTLNVATDIYGVEIDLIKLVTKGQKAGTNLICGSAFADDTNAVL